MSGEVRELEPVAPSPSFTRCFGEWTCGFVILRGRDVPVVDLRIRLNLAHGARGRHPCIVVVEIATEDGPRLAGFLADRVADIVHARERDFVHGKLRFGRRSLHLFDPELLIAIGTPEVTGSQAPPSETLPSR